MGLFDKKKKLPPPPKLPVNNQATKLIAPSDYVNYFDAKKQPEKSTPKKKTPAPTPNPAAPTALIAPSDYENYFTAGQELGKKPVNKKAPFPEQTALVGPEDYVNYFDASKQNKQKITANKNHEIKDYAHIYTRGSNENGTALYADDAQSMFVPKSPAKTSKSSRRRDDEDVPSRKSASSRRSVRPDRANDEEDDDALSKRLAAGRRQNNQTAASRSNRDDDEDDRIARILAEKKRNLQKQTSSTSRVRKAASEDEVKSRIPARGSRTGGNRDVDDKKKDLEDMTGQALLKRITAHLNDMMSRKSKEIVVNKDNVRQYFQKHGITDIKV